MPPDLISVDTADYFSASANLADVVDVLWGDVETLEASLMATGSMAGSDPGAQEWGSRYDDTAAGVFGVTNSLGSAMANYSALLRQAGINHGVAEWRAAGGDTGGQFERVSTDYMPSVGAPPSSVGDSGPGLQGAIDLAAAVGISCPNGDTGKLRDAARSWMAFQQNLRDARRGILTIVGALHERIESPDIANAYRELRQLAEACADNAMTCVSIAQACLDHADELDRARNSIRATIEQFAIEEAAAIAVGVGLAWLTVGVSAAASAVIAAGRFAAAATKVRRSIDLLCESRRATRLEDALPVPSKLVDIAARPKVDLDGYLVGDGRAANASGPIVDTPQQRALEYNSRAERLDHTFADKHGLDGLVDGLGSRDNVVRDMLVELDRRTLAPGRFEEVVTVGGTDVTVRGAVVDGVIKIGTAFIP